MRTGSQHCLRAKNLSEEKRKKKSEYTVHWGTQKKGTLIFKTEKSDQEHSTELVD